MTTSDDVAPRSSGEWYYQELFKAIRSGERVDPDLWLNPDTDEIELRPERRKIE